MQNQNKMPMDSKRIKILLAGILIMLTGFFVMTLDKADFGFGFLGITLGPILVLIGVFIPILSLFNLKK